MKRCSACKESRAKEHFTKNRGRHDGLNNQCRVCTSKSNKKYRAAHPERLKRYAERTSRRRRGNWYKKTYGITIEAYEAMYAAQNGLCAICNGKNAKRRLAVDHEHATGQVRGLLCNRCNQMLWEIEPNKCWIDAAIKYLAALNR